MFGKCFPKKCTANDPSEKNMAHLKMNCKKFTPVSGFTNLLPDDRPITAISVVEDIDKCPPNYTVVSKTYDQDIDADLWRESGLFIRKKGRYICHSKTEGVPNYVVQEITVLNEREYPPDGFSIIPQTIDTDQKAWRKKQVCYKLRNRDSCSMAVTDIIVCSRIKKAPTGFTYAGEVNGVVICYKTSSLINEDTSSQSYENINVLQTPSPNPSTNGINRSTPPQRPPKPKFTPKSQNGIYPNSLSVSPGNMELNNSLDRDYEILKPNSKIIPTRPAPQPPQNIINYGTLPGSSDLDGVPFVFNPLLNFDSNSSTANFPVIKIKTQEELDKEYYYDFRAERET